MITEQFQTVLPFKNGAREELTDFWMFSVKKGSPLRTFERLGTPAASEQRLRTRTLQRSKCERERKVGESWFLGSRNWILVESGTSYWAMASPLGASIQSSNLRSPFLGEANGICVPKVAISRVGFMRKTVECKESRIGKQPIPVPSNVTITMEGQNLSAKGPLGVLAITYPREVKVDREESGLLKVKKTVETRRANQMHGLFRTLTDNMVVGVSKGFEKRLQLIGVGYRATIEGKDIVLNLGFSHPVKMRIPDGLQVKVEDNTRIIVSGYNKSDIGQFAASIRKWRPPEPYKGKGVKYADEIVRRKEGKAGKKK
ncbi:50S ribosomal protein L6 [Abeliophyllum distichum]|uniref:Large ribosomal subunit protein uL6c n=1 Tax=Abeliophyllum distichum TaxID=126358 RepID=A0ABD1Q6N2_9LAMI